MKERLIWIGLIIVLIIVILLMKKCNQPIKESNTIYKKINDSTQFYKDKLGRTHATISLLQGENAGLFAKIETKDSTIIELQKLVANNKTNLSNGGNAVI